jgi:hypothetical protein
MGGREGEREGGREGHTWLTYPKPEKVLCKLLMAFRMSPSAVKITDRTRKGGREGGRKG